MLMFFKIFLAAPAQRSVISMEACVRARSAGYSVHSSNAMMMSAPSPICACHGALRRKEMRGTVEVRAKSDALFAHFA